MGELTITFSGICTHFHDCIPSSEREGMIPMRSVLPNALGVRFGMVRRPEHDLPSDLPNLPIQPTYYLMPHVAVVADAATNHTQSSYLYGAFLEVLNVDEAQGPFTFEDGGYHLRDYVDDPDALVPSWTVVQGYNAACYVDFHYGTGRVVGDKNDPMSSLTTVVTIKTLDEIPMVQITPFPSPASLMNATPPWSVTSGTLFVSNQDFDQTVEDHSFDFMLNYLTTFPGIPRFLKKNLPGMGRKLDVLTGDMLGQNMQALGGAIKDVKIPITIDSLAASVLQGPVPLDQSCSDSQYP